MEDVLSTCSEKRIHERAPVSYISEIIGWKDREQEIIARGFLRDISFGGALLKCGRKIDSSEITLNVCLYETKKPLTLSGLLVRKSEERFSYEYGIKFIEVSLLKKIRLWFHMFLQHDI